MILKTHLGQFPFGYWYSRAFRDQNPGYEITISGMPLVKALGRSLQLHQVLVQPLLLIATMEAVGHVVL